MELIFLLMFLTQIEYHIGIEKASFPKMFWPLLHSTCNIVTYYQAGKDLFMIVESWLMQFKIKDLLYRKTNISWQMQDTQIQTMS